MDLVFAILSVVIVSLISLVSISTFLFKNSKIHKTLLILVSFSTGALFGDVFFHLLPEAVEESGFGLNLSFSILAGIILSFIIEKIIHWRHCHLPHETEHIHPFAAMNLYGDGVHNFIDGLIIGASYLVSIPIGIATTLAVILHEIPQEIGDTGVLLKGGLSRYKVIIFNFISAIVALLGTLVAFSLNLGGLNLISFLIPFAAGNFIYIAGADLIPELHKEVKLKNSLLQLGAILLGLAIMYLLLFLEI